MPWYPARMMIMGLRDYVTDTDPCTLNPGDPVCQAFGQVGPKDPCEQDPNQSFCQAAIRNQYVDPNIQMDTSLNPASAVSPSAAAAAIGGAGWKWPLAIFFVILGGGAFWLYRSEKKR